jgi:hypothetical protein
MNGTTVRNHVNLLCVLLTSATLLADFVCEAQTAQRAAPVPARIMASTNSDIPKSVFVIPKNPQEGRDPFFPNSVHPYGISEKPQVASPVSSLVLKGLSGPPEARLAMINGRTFKAGEEAEVSTPTGRVTIRVVEIRSDSAVVEVGGVRQELHMRPDF